MLAVGPLRPPSPAPPAPLRFWEGRHLWAKVIGHIRSLARAGAIYVDGQDHSQSESFRQLTMWLASFPVALRQHLTGERDVSEFAQLNETDRGTCNVSPKIKSGRKQLLALRPPGSGLEGSQFARV